MAGRTPRAPGADGAQVLELVDAAFDQMPFLVDVLVEREFLRSRRVRGNDGQRVDGLDIVAEVIGIKGGVAQYPFGRQTIDERLGLGDVVALARGKDKAHR